MKPDIDKNYTRQMEDFAIKLAFCIAKSLHKPTLDFIYNSINKIPSEEFLKVGFYFDPFEKLAYLSTNGIETKNEMTLHGLIKDHFPVQKIISTEIDVNPRLAFPENSWMRLKNSYTDQNYLIKASTITQPDINFESRKKTTKIAAIVNPVSAILAGALVGGLGGYGTGELLTRFGNDAYEPQEKKDKKKKTLALLGALGLTLPGLWWASLSTRYGPGTDSKNWQIKNIFSGWPFDKEGSQSSDSNDLIGYCIEKIRNSPMNNLEIDTKKARDYITKKANIDLFCKLLLGSMLKSASVLENNTIIKPANIAQLAIGFGSSYNNGILAGRILGYMNKNGYFDRLSKTNQNLIDPLLNKVVSMVI